MKTLIIGTDNKCTSSYNTNHLITNNIDQLGNNILDISQNKFEFRIYSIYFFYNIKISKDHEAGIKIIEMINDRRDGISIKNYIKQIALSYINTDDLDGYIESVYEDGFEAGMNQKINEIKNILNIS